MSEWSVVRAAASASASTGCATQDLQGFFDLISEIRCLVDEKIEIVGVAMPQIMPAERRPAGQIKRRIHRREERQNLVHERIEPIRIKRVGHNDNDPEGRRDTDDPQLPR